MRRSGGEAVAAPGELTGPLVDEVLDDVVEVSSDDIAQAIVLLLERTKLVVEGAGAVGVAALAGRKIAGDGPVAIVLSGGNIDASTLIEVVRHGVTVAGRHLVVRMHVVGKSVEENHGEAASRPALDIADVERGRLDTVFARHGCRLRSRQLRYPGLEKGDLVELEYSITPRPRDGAPGGYFGELVLFSGHAPARLKRYVLLAPAARK